MNDTEWLKQLTNTAGIPSGADFNDYVTVGSFSVGTNANAQTISNMPHQTAGMLFVRNSNGFHTLNVNTPWQYGIQEYKTNGGVTWIRTFNTLAEGLSTLTFTQWRMLATEEAGVWTPVLQGTNVSGAFGYTIQRGYYTRVGKQITANFHIDANRVLTLGDGEIAITGLPSLPNDANHSGAMGYCRGGENDYIRECLSFHLTNMGLLLKRHVVRDSAVISIAPNFRTAFPRIETLAISAILQGSIAYQIV